MVDAHPELAKKLMRALLAAREASCDGQRTVLHYIAVKPRKLEHSFRRIHAGIPYTLL